MKLRKQPLLVSLLMLTSTAPLLPQVEKISIATTGISCGVCAAVSEIHIKRMAGVDRVVISLAKEAIVISYKPGADFAPWRIREILQRLGVGVDRLQVTVRGCVQERPGKRFFMAGKDKFVLVPYGDGAVPRDAQVLIEAILNDRLDPMELKLLSFKQL